MAGITTTIIPQEVKIDGETIIKDSSTGEIKVNIDNDTLIYDGTLGKIVLNEKVKVFYFNSNYTSGTTITINANEFKKFYVIFAIKKNEINNTSATTNDEFRTVLISLYKDGVNVATNRTVANSNTSYDKEASSSIIWYETDVSNSHTFYVNYYTYGASGGTQFQVIVWGV